MAGGSDLGDFHASVARLVLGIDVTGRDAKRISDGGEHLRTAAPVPQFDGRHRAAVDFQPVLFAYVVTDRLQRESLGLAKRCDCNYRNGHPWPLIGVSTALGRRGLRHSPTVVQTLVFNKLLIWLPLALLRKAIDVIPRAGHRPKAMFANHRFCLPKTWGIVGRMKPELDWERLGRYVRAARGPRSQRDIRKAGGPSDETISKIERGKWRPKRGVQETLDKLDVGLDWEPGSAVSVLEGGEPTPVVRRLGRALATLIPAEPTGLTSPRAELLERLLNVPATSHDTHFERAERLLTHAHASVQQGDHLGAIHGLEGVWSTVELLVDRITDEALAKGIDEAEQKEDGDAVETTPQSDTPAEVGKGEEVSPAGGDPADGDHVTLVAEDFLEPPVSAPGEVV